MHQQIKKYVSLFFLLTLFFPILEKAHHELEHKDDIHCTASDKHFHELEHNCSICEFTIINSIHPVKSDVQLYIATQHFSFLPFIETNNGIEAFQYLPARAPPIA